MAHHSAVVASHDLPLGTLITKEDVKLVPWPSSDPLPGGFDTIEKVVNRGVVAPVMTERAADGEQARAHRSGRRPAADDSRPACARSR